jgi:hypothetical protein
MGRAGRGEKGRKVENEGTGERRRGERSGEKRDRRNGKMDAGRGGMRN